MFRPMNSVVRTVRQSFHKKPFSTTANVRGLDFEKNLKKLQKTQMEALTDDRPTFLRSNHLLLGLTFVVGTISTGLTIKALYDLMKAY